MGEENKEEGKKEEEAAGEIVLKVDMHCEACARKVAKALKGFEGVEEVSADCRRSRVVVKGKAADPIKVRDRLQKKSGKAVELISPSPLQEQNKEPPPPQKEDKKDNNNNNNNNKPPPAPVVTVVVLKVGMHCEACAQVIQKRIRKIQGVESVETELVKDQVTVKGEIEAAKLVDYVYKRTGKQASIVTEEEEEIKKQEEQAKKKEDEDKKEGDDENNNKEKKKEEDEDDNNKTDEIKRNEYWPSKNYVDYAYAPHIFSDENPNACSLM